MTQSATENIKGKGWTQGFFSWMWPDWCFFFSIDSSPFSWRSSNIWFIFRTPLNDMISRDFVRFSKNRQQLRWCKRKMKVHYFWLPPTCVGEESKISKLPSIWICGMFVITWFWVIFGTTMIWRDHHFWVANPNIGFLDSMRFQVRFKVMRCKLRFSFIAVSKKVCMYIVFYITIG